MAKENQQIIVKKYKKGHGGHHGGAWKIAYADFVTAMMAFFLMMWLISVSSEETKKGIVEYFTSSVIETKASSAGTALTEGKTAIPPISDSQEETEIEYESNNKAALYNLKTQDNEKKNLKIIQQIENGQISVNKREANAFNKVPKEDSKRKDFDNEKSDKKINSLINEEINLDKKNIEKDNPEKNSRYSVGKEAITEMIKHKIKNENIDGDKEEGMDKHKDEEKLKNKNDQQSQKALSQSIQDKEKLEEVLETIKKSLNSIKEIAMFKHNLIIELTNEGLKIQIIDSPNHEMFKTGSPEPERSTEQIIQTLGKIIAKLPNKIDITGHTDSQKYAENGYGNWELSSDRAHATRRILEDCSIKHDRFSEVTGRADRDPYNKKNSKAPENRRISITVLYNE